jgi:hypothetical protein
MSVNIDNHTLFSLLLVLLPPFIAGGSLSVICEIFSLQSQKIVPSQLLGFPNRVLRTRFHPQRLGHFVPLSFSASGGKIQATRYAGGR